MEGFRLISVKGAPAWLDHAGLALPVMVTAVTDAGECRLGIARAAAVGLLEAMKDQGFLINYELR